MTETVRPLGDQALTDGDAGRPQSAGAMLRQAREEAGLHIGASALGSFLAM